MELFKAGSQLTANPKAGQENGSSVKILKHIGSGAANDVYLVEHEGAQKALVWHRYLRKRPVVYYENLEKLVELKPFDERLLWLEAIVSDDEGLSGYILPLIPQGYHKFTDFMRGSVRFESFKAMVDACINLVSVFERLHSCGYQYHDFHDASFYINPLNGDVKITDTDNIFPFGTYPSLAFRPKYMAPECVIDEEKPNVNTDYFVLSVLLFELFCGGHPLEGKQSLVPYMTQSIYEKIYGSDALFIFDPYDSSNAPVKHVHSSIITRWGYMPTYVKDSFIRAFGRDAIKNPERRITGIEWLRILTRFRGDIVKCSCGNEVFIANTSTTVCDECGKSIDVNNVIKLSYYSIPAVRGNRIYRCQLGECSSDVALDPVALVVGKDDDPTVIGLRNMTEYTWSATTPSGKAVELAPGEVAPMKNGIVLEVYESQIKFN